MLLLLLLTRISLKLWVAPILGNLVLDLLSIVVKDADKEELEKGEKDKVDADEQPKEVTDKIIAIVPVEDLDVIKQVAEAIYHIVYSVREEDKIKDVDE